MAYCGAPGPRMMLAGSLGVKAIIVNTINATPSKMGIINRILFMMYFDIPISSQVYR